MDLLGQVLARLPVQRISDLVWDDPAVLRCVRTRLRTVNQLSGDYLSNLQEVLGSSFVTAYLALCAFQGELFNDSNRHVSPDLVCSRAIFLRDIATFRQFIPDVDDRSAINIDLALASDDEQMILALLKTDAKSCFHVIDPEIVNWQPGVVRAYLSKFSEYPTEEYTAHMAALAGYLRARVTSLINLPGRDIRSRRLIPIYWRSYFLSALVGETDRFSDRPDLNAELDIIRRSIMLSIVEKICVYAGYFPPRLLSGNVVRLRQLAVKYIQPELLEILPPTSVRAELGVQPADVQFKFPKARDLNITHSLAQRARRMVSVIDRIYPGQIKYRTICEAIGGLPIRGQIDSDIIQIMSAVAHPELTIDQATIQGPWSTVRYDLVQQVRTFPAGNLINLRMAYIEGKLLQCFKADEMEKMQLTVIQYL